MRVGGLGREDQGVGWERGLLWRQCWYFGYFISLLLILYIVMGFELDCDTLMDSLLNTRYPLTLKHNSPFFI